MDNNQHKDLDKFFQGKLNDRQFEYQDDFWAEMETLIPEENTDTIVAGNARRRYIIGTLLMLLIGFNGWLSYPYSANSIERQINSTSKIESSIINNTEESNNLITDSKDETKENNTLKSTKKTTNNKGNNHQSVNNAEQRKYDKNNSFKKSSNRKNTFLEENLNPPNQLLNNKEGMSFPSNIIEKSTKETNTKRTKGKPFAALSNIDNKVKKENIGGNQVNDNIFELGNPLNKNNTENGNLSILDNSNKNQFSDYTYLKTLSISNIPNDNNINKVEPTCDGCPRLPNLQSINVGLIAGLSVSQGWKNTLSRRANPSLDPTIGLRFEYASNPIAEWTFNSEIIYSSRSSLNAQYGYDSTSYGFGATTVSRNINIEELHNIALPIYAVYKKDKHQFMGGLSFNYLINAQSTTTGNGTLYSTDDIELFNVATTEQWGYTSAFNRFDVGLTLGYDYEIRQGWRLGTRINYGLTDAAKNNVFNNNTFDNNLNIRLLLTCDLLEFRF